VRKEREEKQGGAGTNQKCRKDAGGPGKGDVGERREREAKQRVGKKDKRVKHQEREAQQVQRGKQVRAEVKSGGRNRVGARKQPPEEESKPRN